MMKQILILCFLTAIATATFAQETFRKRYFIPNYRVMEGKDTVYLKADTTINFSNLTDIEKEKLRNQFKDVTVITKSEDVIIGTEKTTITKSIKVDEVFYNSLSAKTEKNILTPHLKGYVKFEEDGTLLVNRHLIRDSNQTYTRFPTAYFKLKNRQVIRLWYDEFSVSALVVPIKLRSGKGNLDEEISTAINGNVLLGYSFGKTSFFYRDKVGNKSNTWKITVGIIGGASSVVLNKSNTTLSGNPITDGSEITKGLVSVGGGVAFSFNKINFGVFRGVDYAKGDQASRWNYNKKPWWGFAVGYSLLSLQ